VRENKIDSHTLSVLEFDKIIKFLCRFAATEVGKNYCHNSLPLTSPLLIQERLLETSEMKAFLSVSGLLPFKPFCDLVPLLKKAEIDGTVLSPLELWEILLVIVSGRLVNEAIKTHREQHPALWSIAQKIKLFLPIEEQISESINAEGEILDTASKDLARIRRKINQVRNTIRVTLDEILTHPQSSLFA
jgi:DNA mismatch repair protein MutS2